MTEVIVCCDVCRAEDGRQKRWRWLCEECAEEQLYSHKEQTGHQPWMVVVTEPAQQLQQHIDQLAGGWW